MRTLLFPLLFLGVMFLLNYYIQKRLFKRLHFKIDRYTFYFLALIFFLEIMFVIESFYHPFVGSPALFYILSLSVAVTVTLFFVTLLYDLLHTTAQQIPFDQSRRRFMKIAFDMTMLILAFSYLVRGLIGGLKKPYLNRVEVFIKDFTFDAFTIVQFSDVHIGTTIGKNFVQECVDRINALKPDMVVITGDLLDRKIEDAKDALAPLKELQTKYGTYFILGNHEYFYGAQDIADYMPELNITALLNDSVIIGSGTNAFNLVGLNDLISLRMESLPVDTYKAFAKVNKALPTILLSHQPKSIEIVTDNHYDLMLSGHTHGGQIFPFGFLVMLQQPFLSGLHTINAAKQIFVSRGAGYWGPPVRVFAPSEISVLTIKPQIAKKAIDFKT
ncbi:MAG: metallophosphoesterase [Thiovulaceae bacterium]|nr:metallophosphoesterase [Sulfurimonadaceae bacterium]